MPTYEITSPNLLTSEDWDTLKGTALLETMIRNRIIVRFSALNSVAALACQEVTAWLEEHTAKLVYFNKRADSLWHIYFEDSAEMIAFTLAHKDEPLPEVPEPPKATTKTSLAVQKQLAEAIRVMEESRMWSKYGIDDDYDISLWR